MKIEIKIPSLGESISEITIGQIIAPNGSTVKADSEILEMETDKVNQLLYASQGGTLTLTVKSGDQVQIDQVVGYIETSAASKPEAESKSSPKKETPSIEEIKKEEPKEKKIEKPVNEESQKVTDGNVRRFQKEDLLAELKETPISKESSSEQKSSQPIQLQSSSDGSRESKRPMSKIRKVIASRLVQAQQTMAMLTTFNEVDMTPIMHLRERYKETFIKKYGSKLGLMSFFVKAVVSALKQFPDLNSYIDGDEIVHRNYYDIGVAVGTEKGVIVPVIRNADHLTFAEIEQSLENFAKRAREGKLEVSDLQGGGFTITNGGTYGSLLSTPILLPPQCGILGMHKIEKRPVVINDAIVIRSMMYLALSYDHRLIDGKEAVSFLVHIKNMLEDSSRLLLEI
ncbi:MAG: 2-oxoglutarate dehydrogenase complex dihydrolipoyllysine-residue succinyltransferase [Parachlamydiaceae bacterium]|nr:2-oxoglutarate dehydrogenase complex dihydrolipoyllysine-residue succinyltransferase [Parachlamydiaceae bacterium]